MDRHLSREISKIPLGFQGEIRGHSLRSGKRNVQIGLMSESDKLEFADGSAPRTTLSFRTSAHTGVGISIEFRAAYRHTDRPLGTVFRHFFTRKGASIREIATPV